MTQRRIAIGQEFRHRCFKGVTLDVEILVEVATHEGGQFGGELVSPGMNDGHVKKSDKLEQLRYCVHIVQFRDQQDKLDRYVNGYATQSFRDQADRDYIAARLAGRAELMPQFLWSAQQAVEKYLKALLLYNRIKVPKLTHDLIELLDLTRQLSTAPFKFDLRSESRKFIDHVAKYGLNRYLERPYFVHGYVQVELDLTIWDLRRYCQVLHVFGKALPPAEAALISASREELAKSSIEMPHRFRLRGGFLEQVLATSGHPARQGLIWNNAMYSGRKRPTVKAKVHMTATNPYLYLYPEMLDELLKFSPLPRDAVKGYRAHLDAIRANPSLRP